jgi:hypothetical protein
MVEYLWINKFKGPWKEMAEAQYEVLYTYLLGGTESNHENVCQDRF